MTHETPGDTDFANSFDRAADAYERARPSYPLEAAEWLVPLGAHDVLDLGAGTGKFTRLIAGGTRRVVAVDPSANMLAQLTTAVPGVETLVGTGESIPLPDASVDAVVVAQAWHWFDHAVAVPEIARVLRPGGTLGLIWNMRDESVPWVASLMAIIGDSKSDALIADPQLPGTPFGVAEYREVLWSNELTRDGLFDLVASRSTFIVADENEKQRVLSAVTDLLQTAPELAGREAFTMPYRTHSFRTVREA